MPAGRPSSYTPEMGRLICERIATHDIGLKRIILMYGDMPDYSTIATWRTQFEEFAKQYRKAREYQAELLAESINELAEVQTYVDDKGVERIDAGILGAQKLKIFARQWTAARILSKIYGDRSSQETVVSSTIEDSTERLKKQKEQEKEY